MRFVLVIAFVLCAVAGRAHAQDADATEDAMQDYFAGEKRGGLILGALGVGGLVAGGLMLRSSNDTAKGASYTFLGMGVVHLAAGIFVYVASDGRIDDFGAEIAQDPAAWIDREASRMKGVSTQFTVLKIVEVVLIAGGLGTAYYAHRTDKPRLRGATLALALEAALTLGFDIWASRRAHDYRDELATLDVSASIAPDEPAVMFVHGGSF